MISITKAKQILNAGQRKYTDEQVVQIRDFLYFVAHLEVKEYIGRNSENRSKHMDNDTLKEDVI
jgi:hypothetical protein